MSPAQRQAAALVEQGPRGAVRGPFAVLLHSPGGFTAAQQLGAYLRFESEMPATLRELAVLATARHWRQDYEWRAHARIALDVGVPQATIDAVLDDRETGEFAPDEAAVLAFCRQLHRTQQVDDQTYQRAQDLLGPAGVIDLCMVCGYYALLAMAMNATRNPLPPADSPFGRAPGERL